MNVLIVSFMLFNLVNALISSIVEGGGGMAVTRLTADLSASATTIHVASTSGFLRSDYIIIGNEKIRYSSKTATTFIVATNGRGWDDTEAVAHAANSKVYSPPASVLNAALGYNVASTGASVGEIDIPLTLASFFTKTLPKLITWDFAQFKLNAAMRWARYVLMTISVGFLIYIAIQFVMAFGGVLQRIWVR